MQDLGIIGFGNFGKLLTRALKPFFNIWVYDSAEIQQQASEIGVRASNLETVASKEIVILAVPVRVFESVLLQIKDKLHPRALVLDVSSVKVKPVELMKKHLPQNVELIGTHPLFGPESTKNGFVGLNITLCDIRSKRLPCLKDFLNKHFQLNIFEKTPQQHDKEMAYVQVLTHFVAKALQQIDIPTPSQSTRAYENLFQMKEYLRYDSEALFMTLQQENPFGAEIRKEFFEKLIEIDGTIKDV